jgi:hypothetical protein
MGAGLGTTGAGLRAQKSETAGCCWLCVECNRGSRCVW